MNNHKNKHIRAAVEYALEHGWRLVLAGPGHISGARCTVRTKGATAAFGGFSARRASRRTTPGGCAAESTIARIIRRQAHEDL